MKQFLYFLLFVGFTTIEALIFSAPVRIASLRHWTMTHRVRRWAVIIGLSVALTLVNYVGLVWIFTGLEIVFDAPMDNRARCLGLPDNCESPEQEFERIFKLDYDLQLEFINELTLRRLFFTGEGYCFSNRSDVCQVATSWLAIETERKEAYAPHTLTADGYMFVFMLIMIVLSPSFLTGYFVYRITRDYRKQKRS